MKIDIKNIFDSYIRKKHSDEACLVCTDKTGEYYPLAEIVNFLALHNLSINPKNFELTWQYFCGDNQELRTGLNSSSAASELNNQSALEIYENYFNAALDERIDKIFQRAVEQIRNTTRIISTGNENAIQHENQLIEQAGNIRGGRGSLDKAIEKLLDLSSMMVESTRENREQISHTNAQLVELQNELDVARSEADHDNLTRLPNRRKFDRDLDALLHRLQDDEQPFILAFVDIDNFKRINDTFGHQCGDRVLRLVADELSLFSDNRCHISRYGGEEFAILFEDRHIDDVFQIVDECRNRMANKSLVDVGSDQSIGRVTFSVGMVQCRLSDTKSVVLRKADIALYNAKAEGRNMTCVYSSGFEKRRISDS